MKIRNRLTIAFAFAAFSVMTTLGVLVYLSTAKFHEREFFLRLEERVQLTEQIFLEKNEAIGQAVRDKFLQRLDHEEEYAISLEGTGVDSLKLLFYPGFYDEIMADKSHQFHKGIRQGVGKIYDLPSGQYVVVVTAIDVFGHTKLAFLKKILLVGILLSLLLMIGVGRFFTRRALEPLEEKIHKASAISASNLGLRLGIKNPDDEIGELAVAFNRMLDRLQTSFESQRNFVSNASHEIRTPLTAIIGEADVLLERERSPAEYQASLRNIVEEAERLQKLTQQLLELSKAEALASLPEPEILPLDQLLLEVVERFSAQHIRLEFAEFKSEPLVLANRHLLHIALSNLVDNALKYTDNQLVTIALTESHEKWELKITDQGIGINAADIGKIFNPLYRARNARKIRGHGIGLPLANKIIEVHRGQLTIFSAGEDKGTLVCVILPKATN